MKNWLISIVVSIVLALVFISYCLIAAFLSMILWDDVEPLSGIIIITVIILSIILFVTLVHDFLFPYDWDYGPPQYPNDTDEWDPSESERRG